MAYFAPGPGGGIVFPVFDVTRDLNREDAERRFRSGITPRPVPAVLERLDFLTPRDGSAIIDAMGSYCAATLVEPRIAQQSH